MIEKLHEELAEFDEARSNARQAEMEDELGDLLFVLVNLARFVKVDPEQALRRRTRSSARASAISSRSSPSAEDAGRTNDRRKWRRCGRKPKAGNRDSRALPASTSFTTAVRLQQNIWGFDEIELLPVRLFVVATKIGGQVFGAYRRRADGGVLPRDSRPEAGRPLYLHSHMLGVLPDIGTPASGAC